MRKILSCILVFCIALFITACNDVVSNQENEVKNEFAMKIDQNEVDSISLEYDNSGQYHLTDEETAHFIEMYNQSKLLENSNSDLSTEICTVIISKTNGGNVLLDMHKNVDYNFMIYEFSNNEFSTKQQIQNTALTDFVEELINVNFYG